MDAQFASCKGSRMRMLARLIVVTGLTIGLLGCVSGANVNKAISIPKPVIESVPVTIGLHISEDLRNHVHQETVPGHGTYTIEIGVSQEHLFTQVLGAVFDEVVVLDSLGEIPDDVSAIVVPKIETTQISLPHLTGDDVYEVWIKYSINLRDAESGESIHNWTISSYGNANRHNYGNPLDRASKALRDATAGAIRDTAAIISFAYVQQQAVQDWIGSTQSP